jgi:hypothetical protein
MYVYCHMVWMLVQGSLFPLILGCSRESVPFVWVCLYIYTASLQLVYFLSIQFLHLIEKKNKQQYQFITYIISSILQIKILPTIISLI